MYAGGDGTHRRGRDPHFISVQSLDTGSSTGEDLHCKCCCDLGLEETMGRVSGERAPAFTSEELEKLVDGVLPQYTLLYGSPDKHGQRPPEKKYLACHRQGRPDPWGPPQTEHPLPEKMGGHSPLEQEDGGWPPNMGGVPVAP
ncbi:hypothetical protein NDU88_003739 [Pleurodeles waltl]|uniref:Uncharacterized protein n=1 Tax=Pleurodeles waltl TaxID=8319 RepID=A0AAV7MWG8_PLEWA|nr:hypothetical protein NDU88_003739 [Pleurodeles waltl]